MKVFVFPNLDKHHSYEYTVEACSVMYESNIELSMDRRYKSVFESLGYITFDTQEKCIDSCDIVAVIGGDGTILKLAEAAAAGKKPILGINCGRLGFMASLEHEDLHMLRTLPEKKYTVSQRMMLCVKLGDKCFNALNDVVIAKSDDCKIADFKVSKSGRTISYLRADGVIFSTATGSTAYSMSAGGPIIEPEMQCIEFTQMCAHSLFARSMILSPASEINVSLHCKQGTHAYVSVDGNTVGRITDEAEVMIVRSELMLDIIDIKGGSFFSSINEKLMQPLKGFTGDKLI